MRLAEHPRKVVIAITFAVFLVFDLLFALAMPRDGAQIRSPHRYYHHDLVPNSSVEELWGERRYTIYTNSLGFKDAAVREVPLDAVEYRVLFMGDSLTEGRGVTYEESFAGLIASELRGEVGVLNAAVSSYSPKLYYLKTKYLLETVGLDFDELHVYIDISDAQDEILYGDSVNYRTYLSDRAQEYLLDHSLLGRAVVRRFSPHGEFEPTSEAHHPWENLYFERGRWTFVKEILDSWGRDGLMLARENMAALRDLCRANGIRLTIAVYPWPEQLRVRDSDSVQVRFWRQFAEEHGIEFIDHFPEFMIQPLISIEAHYIPADVHWNPSGHRIIARKWLRSFCSRYNTSSCRDGK